MSVYSTLDSFIMFISRIKTMMCISSEVGRKTILASSDCNNVWLSLTLRFTTVAKADENVMKVKLKGK